MPRPSLFPALLREALSSRTLPREPEPTMVMEDPEQVAAFAQAGRVDGIMASAYLFHSARITQVIQGCKSVVDLGCGPATQLAQVAQLNPSVLFQGVDLSEEMLGAAREHVKSNGISNCEFAYGDITNLTHIPDHSVDGVISTMSLHQLPTFDHLKACFREVGRILKPGGAVYLVDFGRLKSLKTVIYFAYLNAKHQPHIFTLDYERSLRAAFLLEEFEALTREFLPSHVTVNRTFLVPMLTAVKSQDQTLPDTTRTRLREMRKSLSRKYRGDLDDIRVFFRLGGLKNDPF